MEAEQVAEISQAQLYVMTAKIPEDGVEKFNEYERLVLPLLGEHCAKIERRLLVESGAVIELKEMNELI